jgi:predicted esterase
MKPCSIDGVVLGRGGRLQVMVWGRNSVLSLSLFAALAWVGEGWAQGQVVITEIERRIPPVGLELSVSERDSLEIGLDRLRAGVERHRTHPHAADMAVFEKAIAYALRNGEFFKAKKDVVIAEEVLAAGLERLEEMDAGRAPWVESRGNVVRAHVSGIDGSVQPYGLEIPEGLDLSEPVRLYVWLHGRGDTKTDLYFLHERMTKGGKFAFEDGIVLHPFGRQCIGWKSAGEIDVLEAIEHVKSQYAIDEDRIALMGFSMGGAGAWHLGAHYAERWCVVHAGAGFAETARYNKLTAEEFPPAYEQTMWSLYDVPGYVRNLFNLPVIAYSGSEDKQIQAAQVMEGAFAEEGESLRHLIGPGMGHQYHPDTQAEVKAFVQAAMDRGRNRFPRQVHLQTRTARYNSMHWLRIDSSLAPPMGRHWEDTRLDGEVSEEGEIRITTLNVDGFHIARPWPETRDAGKAVVIVVDGKRIEAEHGFSGEDGGGELYLLKRDGQWELVTVIGGTGALPTVKRHGLQGPIDDAFLGPFLVVTPSGESKHPLVQRWVDFELKRFERRWRELFRGELRLKKDTEVTEEDIEKYHLVVWGDAASNAFIPSHYSVREEVFAWDDHRFQLGDASYASDTHVPILICPNPRNPGKYLVINSGPTFREGHDRTNSLQNPKLGDWAVINLETPPSGEAPGKVVSAGFFDERWEPGAKP